MANLHEIDHRIRQVMQLGFDIETGEVFQSNAEMEIALEVLNIDREEKIKHCALFLKEHKAMAAMIEDEETALRKRRKTHEAQAAWLKRWIEMSCTLSEKFEFPQAKITFRKSTRMDVRDAAAVPETLWVYPPPPDRRLDRVAAKAWTKEHNEPPPGVEEIIVKNLQLK